MVETDKPPKDKGQSSGSERDDIDQFDPLQYDSLVNLPNCICKNSKKLKKHNQLLKLMQFRMGLDEVYAPIRSIILTNDPIPDVKGAFATLSRDESHRGSQTHSVVKTRNYAFVARPNNRNNNCTSNNYQPRKANRPNLVCTHCNMNGHTADRCFKRVDYPPKFKRNTGFNKSSASNSDVAGSKDQSSSNSFTDEQYKRLMDLISDKTGSSSMPANIAGIKCVVSFCSSKFYNHNSNIKSYKLYIGWIIDSGASQHMTYTILNMFNVVEVSKLNMTVGHPNGTKAVVTHVGSLRLTDKIVIHDVLVVPGYEVSFLSVHKLSEDNKYRVIFDESVCVIQYSIQRTQVGTGNESNGFYFLDTAVIRTSWTNRNPGRRFYGCPTLSPTCVNFLRWYDPPMCQRSVQIIPGLLRSRKELEEIIAMVEEKRRKLVFLLDVLSSLRTQRKAQQANELSNLTGQRQLLASVNYRRAIIEELERLPGNLVACKTREHLKLIQKVVFVEVIELKKELCLHVLHKIENHVCSARIWLLIIDTKAQESKNKTIDVTGFGVNPSSDEFRLCNSDEWRFINGDGPLEIRGYGGGGDMVDQRGVWIIGS
ncbi:hypothetical protein Tco_1385707 [Tanacetum coccineum]